MPRDRVDLRAADVVPHDQNASLCAGPKLGCAGVHDCAVKAQVVEREGERLSCAGVLDCEKLPVLTKLGDGVVQRSHHVVALDIGLGPIHDGAAYRRRQTLRQRL